MKRHQFQRDGLVLSYLDSGGDGRTLVALHAHWMEGSTYAPFAAELAPEWGVIALDNPAAFTEEVKAFLQDPQEFVGRRDQ
jgi:hypothetical protein